MMFFLIFFLGGIANKQYLKEQVLYDKAINPTAQKAKDKDKGIGNGNTFNRIEIHKKF